MVNYFSKLLLVEIEGEVERLELTNLLLFAGYWVGSSFANCLKLFYLVITEV